MLNQLRKEEPQPGGLRFLEQFTVLSLLISSTFKDLPPGTEYNKPFSSSPLFTWDIPLPPAPVKGFGRKLIPVQPLVETWQSK